MKTSMAFELPKRLHAAFEETRKEYSTYPADYCAGYLLLLDSGFTQEDIVAWYDDHRSRDPRNKHVVTAFVQFAKEQLASLALCKASL